MRRMSAGPEWFRDWTGAWARAQRRQGKAPRTLDTWETYLRHLGRFLEAGAITGPELLTRDVVQRWQDELGQDLPTPSSQHVAVTAVRSFLKWADREELSARPGLWMWVDQPHVPEALPRPLERGELATIVAHYARPSRDLVRLRDRALFWFLVTTSARISEALQVDVDQVRGGRLVIRKKGGDEHLLMMSDRCAAWVDDYLRVRGPDDVAALWIHAGARGRHPLRRDQANAIWEGLTQELGLRRFTSHQLKHTSVTKLGEREDSDDRLVRHVGWKDPAMLRRYRAIEDAERRAMVNRLDELIPPAPAPPVGRRRRRRYRVVDGGKPA